MKFHGFLLFFLLFSILPALPEAAAQGMGMGGPGMRGPGDRDEKEMVIKRGKAAADSNATPGLDSDDYLKRQPSFQLFDLHGYLRLRSDWMYKLDLGVHNYTGVSSPYPAPLTAYGTACGLPNAPSRCREHTLTSTNLRLRLEPVIRPSDTVTIFTAFDIFDNLVLGSTPSGYAYGSGNSSWVAVPGILGTQATIDDGTTATWDAIRVKHVWGRVDLKMADLVFGRMPDHFGMGVFRNDGAGLDADFGDSVDRVGLISELPMWKLHVMLSWDFASQGIPSSVLSPGQDQGQPVDADDLDDATRWTLTVTRKDPAQTMARKLALGQSVFNWSVTGSFLQQKFGLRPAGATDTLPTLTGSLNESDLAGWLVPRDLKLISPGLWAFFARGNVTLEAEAGGRYGWITSLGDLTNLAKDGNDMNILGWGGVFRFQYRWSPNVRVGLETGTASGDDQYENTVKRGAVHFSQLPAFPVDGRDAWNNLMLFHPSYHVDLILFRELLGTVYNATYVKPTFRYVQGQWTLRIDGIASFANEKVATPGNDSLMGFELDADFSYRSLDGSFEAGVAYGLFYPMEGMDHPESIFGSSASDTGMAHTIQGRVLIRF